MAGLPAQSPTSDAQVLQALRQEGVERSRVGEIFDELTVTIGPRLTASPAHTASIAWVEKAMTEWGFSNVHSDPFPFGRGWELTGFSVELVSPRYLPLIGFPVGWSPATNGRVEGTPVWLSSPDAIEANRGKIRDAIAMSRPLQLEFVDVDRDPARAEPPGTSPPPRNMAPPFPQSVSQEQAAAIADLVRSERPAVVLQPSAGKHGTVFVTGRDQGDEAVPTVVLAAEHYNMLGRMMAAGLPVRVAVNVQSRFIAGSGVSHNVIAELPGTDPAVQSEVVMVGAHLDSWHTAVGAVDNADGVAMAMEALRLLKTVGAPLRRTVRVALWGGEEQGLLGSRAWVAKHLAGSANTAARERLSVYFNLDNGGPPVSGFYLEGNQAMRPIMESFLSPLRDLITPVVTLQAIGSTDHVSFMAEGIPAFQAVADFTDYDVRTHHTNMDTHERVDGDALRRSAVVMAWVLYKAANHESRMPRVAVAPGQR